MAMAERVGRAAFIRQQAAILNRPDSRPDLHRIEVPTLVAVGEADQLTPSVGTAARVGLGETVRARSRPLRHEHQRRHAARAASSAAQSCRSVHTGVPQLLLARRVIARSGSPRFT